MTVYFSDGKIIAITRLKLIFLPQVYKREFGKMLQELIMKRKLGA